MNQPLNMIVNIWDNPQNYKKCQKKQYDAAVCMPPKGTVVVNKLEAPEVHIPDCIVTVAKMQRFNQHEQANVKALVQSGKAYVVSDAQPFVVSGSMGEFYLMSAQELASSFVFLKEGQPMPINQQTLQQRLTGQYLEWTRIRSQTGGQQKMACHVPTSNKGVVPTLHGMKPVNQQGVSHGKGDFVLALLTPNGQIVPQSVEVVNGDVFAKTYNNQGWTNCISQSLSDSVLPLERLPVLFDAKVESISAKVDLQDCYSKLVDIDKFLSNVFTGNASANFLPSAEDLSTYRKSPNAYRNKLKLLFGNAFEKGKQYLRNTGIDVSALVSCIVDATFDNKDAEKWNMAMRCAYKLNSIAFYMYALYLGHGDCDGEARELSNRFLDKYEAEVMTGEPETRYIYNQSDYNCADNCVVTRTYTKLFGSYLSMDMGLKWNNSGDVAVVYRVWGNENRVPVSYLIDKKNEVQWTVLSKGFNSLLPSSSGINFYLSKNMLKETRNYNSSEKIFEQVFAHLHAIFECFSPEFQNLSNESVDTTAATYKANGKVSFTIKLNLSTTAEDVAKMKGTADGMEGVRVSREPCTLFVHLEGLKLGVSARHNGNEFKKEYKFSPIYPISFVVSNLFIDLCRGFKIHPSRALFGSERTWRLITEESSKGFSYLKQERCADKLVSITYSGGLQFNKDKTSMKVPINILIDGVKVGTRTLYVDFNYKNFDINSNCTPQSKRLYQFISFDNYKTGVGELLVSYHLHGDVDNTKELTGIAVNPMDISTSLYWGIKDAIGGAKRYNVKFTF